MGEIIDVKEEVKEDEFEKIDLEKSFKFDPVVDLVIKSFDERSKKFVAYGSVTGIVDRDGDIIAKGAYREIIKRAQETGKYPKLLKNHDINQVIGVITELDEDEKGLLVKGHFIDSTMGNDAYIEVKSGAISQMSVRANAEQAFRDKSTGIRTFKNITRLSEVSFVTFPANEESELIDIKGEKNVTIRDIEATLKKSGLSRKQAKALLSGGYNALTQCDAVEVQGLEKQCDAVDQDFLNSLKKTQLLFDVVKTQIQ